MSRSRLPPLKEPVAEVTDSHSRKVAPAKRRNTKTDNGNMETVLLCVKDVTIITKEYWTLHPPLLKSHRYP